MSIVRFQGLVPFGCCKAFIEGGVHCSVVARSMAGTELRVSLTCCSVKAGNQLELCPGYIKFQNSVRKNRAFAARNHLEHCSTSYHRSLPTLTSHANVLFSCDLTSRRSCGTRARTASWTPTSGCWLGRVRSPNPGANRVPESRCWDTARWCLV
jgi:hypothetical protein